MLDKVLIINAAWIAGVLLIAFVGHRREWLRQKAEDAERLAQAHRIDAGTRKIMRSYERQYIELPDDLTAYPDIDRDGFEFIDAALEAIEVPPDVPLPKLSQKRAIEPGNLVRAAAIEDLDDDPVDLWIVVVEASGTDEFVGVVHSVAEQHVAHLVGREIRLHANHIAEIVLVPADGRKH